MQDNGTHPPRPRLSRRGVLRGRLAGVIARISLASANPERIGESMADNEQLPANLGGYTQAALPCSTTYTAPNGQRIVEELGLCWGLTVRSMGFGRGFTSSFKSLQRGEVPKMTENYDDGRQQAVDRMITFAQQMGATAVIGVRFDSNGIGQDTGLQEVLAYGTAIRTEPVSS